MKISKLIVSVLLTTPGLVGAIGAQIASGGVYALEKTVIASGGGSSSAEQYAVVGTIGQSIAGNGQIALGYGHQPGFWTRDLLPSAASVSISGRVTTDSGAGIRNVLVRLYNSSGQIQTTSTASFGYYRVANVEAGSSYVLSISSKRFTFASPSRIVVVADEAVDVDFVAEP